MKRLIPLQILFVLGLVTTRAYGAPYIGASFVTTDSEFETAVDNFEADDSSWKAYAGFEFVKFLGLEFSYRDLGNHQDTSGPNTIDVDIEVFDAGVRAILPLKFVSPFAKAGYGHISTDGTLGVGNLVTDFDEDEWELFYGAGLDVNFGEHFGIRGEWEKYDVADTLNSLSAGVFIKF